jgi:glycosyltransferase involved in cell wall biosynthesis
MPLFSVVLATRDRPVLFAEALASVLAQEPADFEVVAVNDGSAPQHRAAYEALIARATGVLGAGRVQAHWLARRPRGHGQSYALNAGVAAAKGEYVCFLDDDDVWTDPTHLGRLARILKARPAEIVMVNQIAWRDDVPDPAPAWVGGLAEIAARRGVAPDAEGALLVTPDDLMALDGFCHVNALTVRRAFYEEVGGMDEGIRWECDRDLFLRLVDRAGTMLHHPGVVARHNVPDPAKAASMTTSLGQIERWLYQLRVLDKASLFARHPAIRAHGREHKAYAMKRVAEALAAERRWQSAAWYARQALGARPTLRWTGFTAWCVAQGLLRGDPPAG